MSTWTLYWITRFDAISFAMTLMASFYWIILLMCIIVFMIIKNEDYQYQRRELKKFVLPTKRTIATTVFVGFLLTFVACLIPTTKQAAFIYIAPKIINNPALQEDAGELYELTKDWLKQRIREDKRGEIEKNEE